MTLSIATVWFVCAMISTSILLGHFQGRFKEIAKECYREDLSLAWLFGLAFGPVGLFISFFMSGFCQYGLMNPFVLSKYKD